MLKSINPATDQLIQTYETLSTQALNEKINQTHKAFLTWRHTTFAERAKHMLAVADLLQKKQSFYAHLITQEMGKPIQEAMAEVAKCAWVCTYYAQHASTFLANENVDTEAQHSYISYQPLGVILAIMPWNFPFWQVFRFAAPAIMAGNSALLKHASNVPACAKAIEEIFQKAGLPQHLFTNLALTKDVVPSLIAHPKVQAVTLTGSEAAGRAVASAASQHLKKSVLELGGSDAFLILEDADLDHAAATCVKSRMLNAGQSCIGAKRIIVVEAVYAGFLARFRAKMEAVKMGDPLDQNNDIGPIARHDLRDQVHQQVQCSIEKGASCLLGGKIPTTKGAFYPPTLLTDVQKGMPAYEDELFGPVAAIIRAKDEADAIRIANDSAFGLGAAVFTRDKERGARIAQDQLEAGSCFVNELVKSDPRLPFGGIKRSGYGRELSHFGIREFTNIKTIWVQ